MLNTYENIFWDLSEYNSVFFFFLCSVILSSILTILSKIVSPLNKESEKLSAFECGFEPIGDSKDIFSIHFYMVGILFLIFDLEILFLFPWTINIKKSGFLGYVSIIFFILILLIGFFFEWFECVLDWSKKSNFII